MKSRLQYLLDNPDVIRRIVAGLMFGFVLFIYNATKSPTVSFWDCGEFISCSYILGVPHPPGTPLYVLLGRLFSLLPLVADPAARVNLLSSISSAGAALLAFLVLFRLIQQWWPKDQFTGWKQGTAYVGAIVGTLMFAFNNTNWNNSVEAEVYAPAMLLLMFLLWLTVRWMDIRTERRSDRFLVGIVFLAFLSIGIHLTTFLFVPAIFLIIILFSERLRRDYRLYVTGLCVFLIAFRLDLFLIATGLWLVVLAIGTVVTRRYQWLLSLALVLAAVTGFSVQLYSPVRAARHPSINMNDPSRSYASFRGFLERRQYGNEDMVVRAMTRRAQWVNQLGTFPRIGFWGFFSQQYGINGRWFGVLFVVGLLGLYELIRRQPRLGWPFLLMLFLGTVFLVWYMNFADGMRQNPLTGDGHIEVRDRDYFFTPGFLLFGMAIGLGAAGLMEIIRTSLRQYAPRMRTAVLAVVAVALIAALGPAPLRANYFSCDRSRNFTAYDFAHNMLVSCEADAILFNGGDNDTYPLWCLQEVYGIRPDVTAINLALANTDWYIRQIRDAKEVPIRWTDAQISGLRPRPTADGREQRIQDQVFDEILNVNKWQRPINFSLTITDDAKQYMGRSIEGNLVIHGQVYRLQPGQPEGSIDMEANHELYWNCFRYRSIADSTIYKDPHTAALVGNYTTGLTLQADSLRKLGRFDDAIREVNKAIELVPYEYNSYNYLTQLYVDSDREDLIPGLVRRVPREESKDIYYIWAMVTRQKGDKAKAVRILQTTLDSFPAYADAFHDLSRLLYETGDWEGLRTTTEKWLLVNPDDEDARQLLQQITNRRPPGSSSPPTPSR